MDLCFDSVLFDVDGTLWDSTDVAANSYNKVFIREGLKFRVTGDQLKTLFGKPMDLIFAMICPELSEEYRKKLADLCMAEENADLEREFCDYYPGVYETFQTLSEKMPLFIVSNCQKGYIEIVIKGMHLEPFVRDFLCFGDTGTSKDGTMLTLIQKHGLKAPVYVGDTLGDEEACRKAGIPFIYCSYGFGKAEQPVAVIGSIGELPDLIKVYKG